jgi:hypothetical protein
VAPGLDPGPDKGTAVGRKEDFSAKGAEENGDGHKDIQLNEASLENSGSVTWIRPCLRVIVHAASGGAPVNSDDWQSLVALDGDHNRGVPSFPGVAAGRSLTV